MFLSNIFVILTYCLHQKNTWTSSLVAYRLRIHRCHCCGAGSIPGLGTSSCHGCGQKKKKKKKVEIWLTWGFSHCLECGAVLLCKVLAGTHIHPTSTALGSISFKTKKVYTMWNLVQSPCGRNRRLQNTNIPNAKSVIKMASPMGRVTCSL